MPFETFLMIAQIAVALTGFIGITVTLRHGRDGGFSRLLLASILQTTLGAALFAAVINASLLTRSIAGAGALDQLMDAHWRASQDAGVLVALIATTAEAMRHAYLLTGVLAIMALLVAMTYPTRLGPASQQRQQ